MKCEIWMLAILALSCIIASISDLKDGKIYNKYLLYGALLGSVGVLQYYYINQYLLWPYLMNLLIEIVLAFLFFKVNMWGAGDSKLWIFICFLYPFGKYYTYDYLLFPSLYILMFIFIIAYIYVVAETIYIKIRQHKKQELQGKIITNINWIEAIKGFIFHFFFLRIIYRICMLIFKEYYCANTILFALLGLILSIHLYKVVFRKKIKGLIVILGLILMGFDLITEISSVTVGNLNLLSFVITALVLLLRDEMAKYNYEIVYSDSVRAGMILSYTTIMELKKTRVNGLPQFTDESAKCRISQTEAEAIKRWSKSKFGKETVVTVKFLPFGIFMAIGLVAYFMWSRGWGQ